MCKEQFRNGTSHSKRRKGFETPTQTCVSHTWTISVSVPSFTSAISEKLFFYRIRLVTMSEPPVYYYFFYCFISLFFVFVYVQSQLPVYHILLPTFISALYLLGQVTMFRILSTDMFEFQLSSKIMYTNNVLSV
jgi:hypothetical protein